MHYSAPESQQTRGFTILMSVLVASLLLSLGLSIFTIAIKETLLSSAVRESQFAFFAADTGIECALYWDFHYPSGASGYPLAFATSSSSAAPTGPINCNGDNIMTGWQIASQADSATTTFAFNVGSGSAAGCVVVSVGKYTNPSLRTTIQTRGYNEGSRSGATCTGGGPRRVERGLVVKY